MQWTLGGEQNMRVAYVVFDHVLRHALMHGFTRILFPCLPPLLSTIPQPTGCPVAFVMVLD
ncbi:hypothetical protein LWS69_15460 [Bordetella hinzii]|nr:hypothetical protein [Bordetella hinzii]